MVLISIDTLRADHLQLYGYSRPTSPHLVDLAREAVVFDSFFANGGGTLPSHMTMMTSLRPTVHGVTPASGLSLPEDRTTLAELLQGEGYRTAGFVDGGWVRGKFGFRQGFDLYDDEGGRFESILPKAHSWLQQNHDEAPFFLFLHTYDVHSQGVRLPYDCPGDYPSRYLSTQADRFDGCRGGRCATKLLKWFNQEIQSGHLTPEDTLSSAELEMVRSLYDGCINYADDKVGEILGWLRELGEYDRTLVIVTSDHGEEFLDHGLFLHAQGGYEELVHIPLVMKLPGGVHGGTRVGHLTSMVDLMPTVLELLGVSPPREAQGRSALRTIAQGEPLKRQVAIYDTIRTRRWKLLKGREELYDLEQDPAETVNGFQRFPGIASSLTDRIRKIAELDQRLEARLASGEPWSSITPEEAEELRALGYL